MECWQWLKLMGGNATQSEKISVVKCSTCGMKTTGYRCMGKRIPELQVTWSGNSYYGFKLDPAEEAKLPTPTTGCGRLMVPSEEKWGKFVVLECPCDESHGKIGVRCMRHCNSNYFVYMSEEDENNLIQSVSDYLQRLAPMSDSSPGFTCTKCGYTVDATLCITGHTEPKAMARNGFFERCFCSFEWSCPDGCCRKNDSGLLVPFHCTYEWNVILGEC